MRLIDADALAKKLFIDDEYQNCTDDYNEGIKDAIKAVNNEPIVDPVKHGHWLKGVVKDEPSEFIGCSACKHEAYWDSDYGQQLFDYCPYCGSKMDEEVSE